MKSRASTRSQFIKWSTTQNLWNVKDCTHQILEIHKSWKSRTYLIFSNQLSSSLKTAMVTNSNWSDLLQQHWSAFETSWRNSWKTSSAKSYGIDHGQDWLKVVLSPIHGLQYADSVKGALPVAVANWIETPFNIQQIIGLLDVTLDHQQML